MLIEQFTFYIFILWIITLLHSMVQLLEDVLQIAIMYRTEDTNYPRVSRRAMRSAE